mgnify:CR=1 FL=1
MKKLIFILIMLPVIAFSQEKLQQSAENFIISYFKMFEDKKWDEIPNAWAKDAQIVRLDGSISPAAEMIKNIIKNSIPNLDSEKIEINWIATDAIGSNTAMVSVRYIEKVKGKTVPLRVTDNVGVFLVTKEEGVWKIGKWIIGQNFAIIYDNKIDKKYKTNPLASIYRFNSANYQFWGMILYNVESSKKNGITPAEAGKAMGIRFVKSWDVSKGFDGLAPSFVWGLQVMSSYVEVLERDEDTLKARFLPPSNIKNWDVTRDELRITTLNMWSEMANRMGGTCSLTDDGDFWMLELKREKLQP